MPFRFFNIKFTLLASYLYFCQMIHSLCDAMRYSQYFKVGQTLSLVLHCVDIVRLLFLLPDVL